MVRQVLARCRLSRRPLASVGASASAEARNRFVAVVLSAGIGALAACGVAAPEAVAASLPGVAPAAAVGRTGACTKADQNAVTVVIDYGALGGGIAQYCASGLPSGAVGMDALTAVGVDVTGTAQYGDGVVCRLNGKPGAAQPLAVAGDAGYVETCATTPPTSAYWAYWYAAPGGAWTYTTQGALGHRVAIGGFEGWVFELNKTMATSTPPGVNPVTPAGSPVSTGATSTGAKPAGGAPATATDTTHPAVRPSQPTAPSQNGTKSPPAGATGTNPAAATPTGASLSHSAATSPQASMVSGAPMLAAGASSAPVGLEAADPSGPGPGTIAGLAVVGVLVVAGVIISVVRRRSRAV